MFMNTELKANEVTGESAAETMDKRNDEKPSGEMEKPSKRAISEVQKPIKKRKTSELNILC